MSLSHETSFNVGIFYKSFTPRNGCFPNCPFFNEKILLQETWLELNKNFYVEVILE